MEIKLNMLENKKDLVKANNAVKAFKDIIGDKILMVGVLVYDKEEVNTKTGEIEQKTVSCIKLKDGEFISSISPTVENSLNMICQAYEPEEIKKGLEVMVKSQKSNGGRDFLYIDLV